MRKGDHRALRPHPPGHGIQNPAHSTLSTTTEIYGHLLRHVAHDAVNAIATALTNTEEDPHKSPDFDSGYPNRPTVLALKNNSEEDGNGDREPAPTPQLGPSTAPTRAESDHTATTHRVHPGQTVST
jgi:hypothetical protein